VIWFLQSKFSEDLGGYADIMLPSLEAEVGHSLMNKGSKENGRKDRRVMRL